MLPSFQVLSEHLRLVIAGKAEQGHVVDGLEEELRGLPDSYDALRDFARRLADLVARRMGELPRRVAAELPAAE